MAKVDIVLTIVQAAMNFANDPRINRLYASLAFNRNTLQWICQNQDDLGDKMALDAVKWALGQGGLPSWMAQAGL